MPLPPKQGQLPESTDPKQCEFRCGADTDAEDPVDCKIKIKWGSA